MAQQPDEGKFVIAMGTMTWSGTRWSQRDHMTWRMYSHRRSAIRTAKKLAPRYPGLKVEVISAVVDEQEKTASGKTVWPSVAENCQT